MAESKIEERFERFEREMYDSLKQLEISTQRMQGSLETISNNLSKTLNLWETVIIHGEKHKVTENRLKDLEDGGRDLVAKHHALEYKVIVISTTISVGVGVGAYFIGLLMK